MADRQQEQDVESGRSWSPSAWEIGVFTLILGGLKVLVVAGFDHATAVALVSAVGPADAFVSLVLKLGPFALAFVPPAIYLVHRHVSGLVNLGPANTILGGILSLGAAALLLTEMPYRYWMSVLGGALGALVFIVAEQWFARRGRVRVGGVDPRNYLWILVAVYGVSFTLLDSEPWMPAEVLTGQEGRPFAGYVVEDSGRWMTVLGASSRTLYAIEVDEVVERRVCLPGGRDYRSLVEVVLRRPVRRPNPCSAFLDD